MLREAVEADRERVRRWRNHPQVREWSLSQHEITAAEHLRWWTVVMADPNRRVLVYHHRTAPAGIVTFDIGEVSGPEASDTDSPEVGALGARWGFFLDVDGLERRGELVPAWVGLEREAIRYAFDTVGVRRLGGEVLAANTPVLALHQRFGFVPTRHYQRDIAGRVHDVVYLELTDDPRRGKSDG